MKCPAWLLRLFGLLVIASLATNSAHAQTNAVSWVSANGSDTNPCTYASPCLSFGGAISKTIAGGEIHCVNSLESGGNFTINKTVTIDCGGESAVIRPSNSGPAVTINTANPSDKVILRNLNINNFGGYGGIYFVAGGELEVDNVKFAGANTAGISAPLDRTTTGVVTVKNSTFVRMPTGIKLQSTSGNFIISVKNSSFNHLSLNGVEAGTNAFAGVYDSTFTALSGTAILAATATSTVYAENNVI